MNSGVKYEHDDTVAGDHTGRQQNHIWSKEEIDEALNTLYRHKPETISDYLMNYTVGSDRDNPCRFLFSRLPL